MKCSEAYRLLLKDGWYPISQSGSHVKLKHVVKEGIIVFPNPVVRNWVKACRKNYLREPE